MTAAKKKPLSKKPSGSKPPAGKKTVVSLSPKSAKNAISAVRKQLDFSSKLSSSAEKINPRLQALIDKSEIMDVLARFARGIDRMDETLLRSVLHHDATLDFGPGVFQGAGNDYVHWVMGVMKGLKSSHHLICNTRIELEGEVALVESYFHNHVRVEKPIGREDVFLGGRNLDRFERRPAGSAGVWKIAHRKQVLDWARTEAASDLFYHQNPDALWSYRAKVDASYNMAQFPGSQGSGKLPSFLGRHYECKSVKF